MGLFLVKRFTTLIATLLVASLVVFLVLEVLPGDPAAMMLGINAREDTLAALRAELGLDRPAWLRYLLWLLGLVQGDFGKSYTYSVPVAELILERVAISLPLALMAITLSTALAIPLGVLAAARRNRSADVLVGIFAQLGVALTAHQVNPISSNRLTRSFRRTPLFRSARWLETHIPSFAFCDHLAGMLQFP